MRTPKQRERQDRQYRSKGKYAKTNPCYACGKSAGVDYFSHPLTDTPEWRDTALVLCLRCANKTAEMVKLEEFLEYRKQFGETAKEAWIKIRAEDFGYTPVGTGKTVRRD